MSGLRQAFLEKIRIMGNASGCHQLPERSFFYKGKQFPVCARCTGVFIGQVTAVLTMLLSVRIPLKMAILSMVPMGIDWSVQYFRIKPSTNIRRLITGIGGGFSIFWLYYHILLRLIKRKKNY